MTHKANYLRRRAKLLADPTICKTNRDLFQQFFEFEEYKLKRINGLPSLDESTYKTLGDYCLRFRTANQWFKNKPWKDLSEADIKKVYDDLEDGKIFNQRGTPFKDKITYYNKIFKSKPFALAGKDQLARDIITMFQAKPGSEAVRFIEMEDFQKMVDVVVQPIHKFLFWLAWDIGENINSLLQLRKKHFYRQQNDDEKTPEYRVNLPREILKRSRKPRSELTNYRETVKFADLVLAPLSLDDLVFSFQYRQAKKVFDRTIKLTGVKCKPSNDSPTWKDLRSGMACHLLNSGWHAEEINARLGHQPSSKELNKYVNFLALDRHRPKKKLFDNAVLRLQKELEEHQQREKLNALRLESQKNELDILRQKLEALTSEVLKHRSVRQFDPIIDAGFEDVRILEKAKKTAVKLGLHKKLTRPKRIPTS